MSDKKTIKISKAYERRVGLGEITNRYDFIVHSTTMESEIEFETVADLKKKSEILSQLVRDATEKDIKESLKKISIIKKEGKNSVVVGTGYLLDGKEV